jgi:hypothetical protein
MDTAWRKPFAPYVGILALLVSLVLLSLLISYIKGTFKIPYTQEAFTDASLSATDSSLRNMQFLTVKQIGYEKDGTFSTDPSALPNAITKALQMGVRAFTFQIDFMDTDLGSRFSRPGRPTLILRNSSGKLLSKMSGNLTKACQTLANNAFNTTGSPNTSSQPLILYLHITRSPNPNKRPAHYLKYLSQIARCLAPLSATHLRTTSAGNFFKQSREVDLFSKPITDYAGKTIVLCNADTTLFERAGPSGYGSYTPEQDLHYWSNARVYLHSTAKPSGITSYASDPSRANAFLVNYSDLPTSTGAASILGTSLKGKFTIALPSNEGNPSAASLDQTLNEVGINLVPLDFFSVPAEDINALKAKYTNGHRKNKPQNLSITSP